MLQMMLSSPAESEEDMERLTTEQIADIKEYFSRSKEVKTSSLAMKLSHDGLKLIDTIEAQQQEIEQLKEVNRQLMWENISDNMSENITAEQAEQIKALTADKDEQAGRIMQMEEALRQTKTVINDLMACNEISNIADVRGEEAIKAIEALLSPICNTTKLPCAECNPCCEHRAKS